jgi:4-alpha-glucanotransferase
MSFTRATGILLHPSSLPARGGIGDFGPAAYEFVDFLAAARQGLWQVLPLGPLGYGNSPYSATSAFAGNPLLISLERLAERGWIDAGEIRSLPQADGPVDYASVFPSKMPLLAQAARNFSRRMQGGARARFERFCRENGDWLDDFVLFDALRAHHKLTNWNEWPRELAHREPAALDRVRREMADELAWRSALQFAFAEQWRALRQHCARRSVRVVGDIAIFVNYDSADVWTHPELFRLDAERNPVVVSGVPPDFFSETGQRWGNPLYRWDVMKSRGYAWWVARRDRSMRLHPARSFPRLRAVLGNRCQ